MLGHDQDVEGGGFDSAQSLIGGIGPVNIHNRILSGAEITNLASGIVDIADAEIVAAYRFNASDQTYLDVAAGNDLVRTGILDARDGPNQQVQVLEDGVLRITGLTVADIDAGALDIAVSLGVVGAGSITLGDTTNVVISNGANGTDAFTVTGETTTVNAALATLSFDPGADANGAVTLSVSVSDLGNSGAGGALTDNLSIAINVAAVNDAPVAAADAFTGDEDNDITGNVLNDNGSGVDADVDGDTLTISATPVTDVANGTLVLNTNGTFTYTPDANFNGTDSFVYTLEDGNGGTDTATVTLTVNSVNDEPVANDDAFAGDEDNDITGDVLNLRGGGGGEDTDDDNDTLTISATPVTDVANGTLVLNTNGTFTYTPDANFNGTDSFVYTLEDGNGGTDTATVTLTINAVNDAPVAAADAFNGDENTDITGNVLPTTGPALTLMWMATHSQSHPPWSQMSPTARWF